MTVDHNIMNQQAARTRRSAVRRLALAAAVLAVAGGAAAVSLLAFGGGSGRLAPVGTEPVAAKHATPKPASTPPAVTPESWLHDSLGARAAATAGGSVPSAVASRVGKLAPAVQRTLPRGVKVTIDGAGYTVARGSGSVSVASTAVQAAGAWTAHTNGLTRSIAGGQETIVVRGERTELYTRVDASQGTRTWTWRVESTGLTPQLQANGDILWQGTKALVTHAPRIVKLDGSDITPAGSRWTLSRSTGGWQLGLRLDDRALPTPYLIDPDTSAPSQYFDKVMNDLPLRSTTLNGGINTSVTTITVASATGWPSAGDYLIQIDSEVMRVTAGQGTTSWTVVRAVVGTAAASHSNGATINGQGGYWRLDQANTSNGNTTCPGGANAILDSSGYAKHLSVSPTNSSAPVCAVAGALNETGQTAMRVSSANSSFARRSSDTAFGYTGQAPFSAELWLKLSSSISGTAQLIQRAGASGGWYVLLSSSTLYLRRIVSGPTTQEVSVGFAPTTGVWYHIVAVYDPSLGSNQMQLYVNGVLKAKANSAGSIPDTTGAGNLNVAFGLTGDVDDAAVYPVALSCGTTTLDAACTGASQIGAHYARALDSNISFTESNAATSVLSATDASTTATPNAAALWYRPGQSGSFTANSAAVDTIDSSARGGTAAVTSVAFQSAALPSGLSGGGSDASVPYTGAYTWTGSLSGDQAINVTVTNNNSLTSVGQYTLKADSTAPTGGSIVYTDGFNTTGTVALTLANGNDGAGSGVDAASPVLERASATLSAGSCGGFGAFASIGVTASDTSVSSGNCYKYQYKVSDNVGNQATYTSVNIVKVDTVNPANGLALSSVSPAGSAFLSGTTVFYRGTGGSSGGSFALTNTVTDAASGPASSTFGTFGGDSTGWTAFPGTTVTTPAGGPYVSGTVTWTEGATSAPTIAVTPADTAGRSGAVTTLTMANDQNAPGAAITLPTATAFTAGTYSASWSGSSSESGSGFRSVAVSVKDTTTNNYWTGSAFSSGSEVLAAATGTTSWTYTGPASGNLTVGRSYLVTLKSTDNVGNVGTATVTFSFTASNTAPAAPSALSPANAAFFATTTPTLSATFSDPDVADTGTLTFRVCTNGTDSTTCNASLLQDIAVASLANGATGNGLYSGSALTPGTTYFWQVKANDGTIDNTAGFVPATPRSFTIDTTAPGSGVTTPANGSFWNLTSWGGVSSIAGTASDAGSLVQDVKVSIRRGSDSLYWDGTDFASGPELLPTATLVSTGPATFSWTLAAPSAAKLTSGVTYTIRVVARDNVNNSSTLSTTFLYDTSAPTLGMDFPVASTAYRGATWTAGCATAGACGTAADTGGSSLATVEVSLQRGSDSKWWNGSSFVTSVPELFRTATGTTSWSLPVAIGDLTDGSYTVRARATDGAGNVTTGSTRTFTIDTTAPSTPSLTMSESSADTFASGSTVYYRAAGGGGTFTATATTGDPSGSLIEKVTFPGVTGGITPSGNQDDLSAPYSQLYTWTTGNTTAGAKTVTATDNAGNTSTGSFTVVRDATTPTGQSASLTSVPISGYYRTASVALTTGDGSDADAGLDTSTRLIQRERAPLSAGTCGSYDGSFVTVANPDTSMTLSGCYRYRFTIADNVGNVSSPATTVDAKVDLDNPAAPTLGLAEQPASGDQFVSGTTLFFRPTTAGGAGGTFRVTATASDAQSDIKQADFAAVANLTRVGSGTDTTAPYTEDYSWGASAPTGAQALATATDNALNQSSASSITLTADPTAPSTSDNSASFGAWQNASVTVTLTPTDTGGSGVAATYYTTDGSTPTTSSTQGTSVVLSATGQYTVKYFSVDNVGNSESVKTAGTIVRVDRANPTDTVVTASESPAGSVFKSGATIWYRGSAGGHVFLQNTVNDSDSGPASTTFGTLGGTIGGWTFGGSTVGGGSPYTSNQLDYPASETGAPTVLVTSADAAGNVSAGTTVTFQNDSAAPIAGSVTYNGGVFTSTTPTIAFDLGNDGAGSTVRNGQLQRASATLTGSSCGGYGAFANVGASQTANGSYGESGLVANTCYKWRFVVTDQVGNTATWTSANEYKVDTATPFQIAGVGGGGQAQVTGSTAWVKPGGGTFTLKVKAGSTGNYTSIDYPDGPNGQAPGPGLTGVGVSTNSSPFTSNSYTWSAGFTGPLTLNATGHLNPSGTSSESIDVQSDSGTPTTTDNAPGACQGSDVTVTLTPADGQSGVAATYFTTDGSTPTTASTQGTSVTVTASGTTTVKYFSVDNVGNSEGVKTASVCVDKVVPANAISLTGVSPAGSAAISGTTVYYSPAAGGQLQLRNTVDGTGSAAANSATGSLSSPGAGWSHAPSSVSTPSGGPYDSNLLTWNAAATTITVGVASQDAVGNTSTTTTITFTPDAAAPTISDSTPLSTPRSNGGTIGLTGGDTGGSGLAHTYWTVDGTSPLVAGTRTDSTTVSVPDVEGSYTVKFAAVDGVGNASAISTRTITVDKTAPSVATLSALPAVVSNGRSLAGSGTDVLSGVASITYAYCAGSGQLLGTGGCSATGTAIGSSSIAATYPVTWSSQPADGPYTVFARVFDNAGNVTASAGRNVTVDNTVPTIAITAPAASSYVNSAAANPFALTATASADTTSVDFFQCSNSSASCTSGSWTSLGTDSGAPFAASWTLPVDGARALKAVATDGAANTAFALVNVIVDRTLPDGILTAPAGGTVSGSVTLTATSTVLDVAGVQFQKRSTPGGVFANVGAAVATPPFTVSWATGPTNGVNDGTYEVQALVTDLAGNVRTTVANAVTVSNVPKLLQTSQVGTLGTPIALGYSGQLDGGFVPATTAFTVAVNGTAHTVTGVTITFDTVYLAVSPVIAVGDTNVTVDYSVAGAGASYLRDLFGVPVASLTGTLITNNSTAGSTPPVLISATPADGLTLAATGLPSGTITFTADKVVTWSDIVLTMPAGAPAAPAFTAPSGTTATATYGSTVRGVYEFRATISDGVNPAQIVYSHFTIPLVGATDPSATSKTASATATGQLDSSNGTATVKWTPGTFSVPTVVSIDPVLATAGSGAARASVVFGLSTSITTTAFEVTALTSASGAAVTTFPWATPLELVVNDATAEDAPVRSSDRGVTYLDIPRIPGPGLPAGYIDGFWFDAGTRTMHILTTHLTVFALIRDTTPPSAPRSLSGVIAADGVTLRWEPASDNSGSIANYHLFVNGVRTQSFGGVTYEAKLGPFTPGDSRIFQVRASDSRLNLGEATNAVVLLPDVSGMTVSAAHGVLLRAGISLGSTVTVAGSGTAGTILRSAPSFPAVVSVGSTVNLSLSDGSGSGSAGAIGSAGATLVLKVASAKHVALKQRRAVALRVLVSVPAKATITMRTSRGATLATWERKLQSGATIVNLAIPQAAMRAGTYSFTVTARPTGAPTAKATFQRTLVTFAPLPTPTGTAVDVVLVKGPANGSGTELLSLIGARVRTVAKAPDVYDVTASLATNVQVVVVDLDTRGADPFHFVRNLRAVYPDLRIVALSSTAAQVDQARQFGATVVLTKPVSVEILSSVVTDLIPVTTATTRATASTRQQAAAKRSATSQLTSGKASRAAR